MPQTAPELAGHAPSNAARQNSATLEVVALFALISLLAAEPVPGINETHYLPKAKHFIDSSFASRDLFLQSHDSHWLSAGFAGCLATFLPLTAVAWLGRMFSWLFMAWAWRQLRLSLNLPSVLGGLALASWYGATIYGHWAGEWAIGGFEGKSIAYPCIVVAFAELFRGNWSRVWLWLGAAVAWHPLAGGWAGLSFGLAWLTEPELLARAKKQAKWLAAATAIGLIGVLPAATGLSGPNQVGNLVASQVHVFMRLAHHQLPRTFGADRHFAATITLSLLVVATVWYRVRVARSAAQNEREIDACESLPKIGWLLKIVWFAVAFSIVGLVFDLTLTRTRPVLASQLLRFYWFRWSDIAVPFGWTLTFWVAASEGWKRLAAPNRRPRGESPLRVWKSATPALVGIALSLLFVAQTTRKHFERKVPTADDILMQAPGNREIETDRYVDWLAACEWIRTNSPEDSLWFSPEFQQTFKWYAHRAEVVCWKDVPQDNTSVHEWYQRVLDCRAPRSTSGIPKQRTSAELLRLSKKYPFRWILVDRRIQTQPLLDFEIMYPIETSNRSFAIFRIPDGM